MRKTIVTHNDVPAAFTAVAAVAAAGQAVAGSEAS
jgi:hypothetical protein